MAINFPDTPNEGDVHVVGTRSWTWDGTAWTSNTSRDYINTISETEPTNPVAGDTWFKSSTGQTFIYYDSYWIETGVAGPRGPAGADGTDGSDASLTRSIRTESANTTLLAADANQMLRFTGTAYQVLTIPDVLSVGESVQIVQDNTGQIEFSSGSGVTLLSDSGEFGSNGQNTKVDLVCVGAGEYRLYGDLVEAIPTFDVEYLVVAGGGGASGRDVGGGGGAGGYRSSVSGESSGGGASAESVLTLEAATNYTVTVGAGGVGGTDGGGGASSQPGSLSSFYNITSVGGGAGKVYNTAVPSDGAGGSGGGASGLDVVGSGTNLIGGDGASGQGFDGGNGIGSSDTEYGGGGGGGASERGRNAVEGRDGGDGIQSNITGNLTYRAGGGGGAGHRSVGNLTVGNGGLGGGGDASDSTNTSLRNGQVNTGGGAGASRNTGQTGGSGGSGIVILRYPSSQTITIGAGLTGTTSTVGDNKVTEITAGTGNISFS